MRLRRPASSTRYTTVWVRFAHKALMYGPRWIRRSTFTASEHGNTNIDTHDFLPSKGSIVISACSCSETLSVETGSSEPELAKRRRVRTSSALKSIGTRLQCVRVKTTVTCKFCNNSYILFGHNSFLFELVDVRLFRVPLQA